MTTTRAAIEQALAAGPTDGPWVLHQTTLPCEAHGIDDARGIAVSWWSACREEGIEKLEDAAYIAAVNPAAIRQMLADHDAEKKALEDELGRVREALSLISDYSDGWDEDGSLGPKKPLSWETVARCSMDIARAALSPTTTNKKEL